MIETHLAFGADLATFLRSAKVDKVIKITPEENANSMAEAVFVEQLKMAFETALSLVT